MIENLSQHLIGLNDMEFVFVLPFVQLTTY